MLLGFRGLCARVSGKRQGRKFYIFRLVIKLDILGVKLAIKEMKWCIEAVLSRSNPETKIIIYWHTTSQPQPCPRIAQQMYLGQVELQNYLALLSVGTITSIYL